MSNNNLTNSIITNKTNNSIITNNTTTNNKAKIKHQTSIPSNSYISQSGIDKEIRNDANDINNLKSVLNQIQFLNSTIENIFELQSTQVNVNIIVDYKRIHLRKRLKD